MDYELLYCSHTHNSKYYRFDIHTTEQLKIDYNLGID